MNSPETPKSGQEEHSEWENEVLDMLEKNPKVLLDNVLWKQIGDRAYDAVRSLQAKGEVTLWLNDDNEVEVKKSS